MLYRLKRNLSVRGIWYSVFFQLGNYWSYVSCACGGIYFNINTVGMDSCSPLCCSGSCTGSCLCIAYVKYWREICDL